ncbi:AAA domain-containing protein [Paraburkholderia tropica]
MLVETEQHVNVGGTQGADDLTILEHTTNLLAKRWLADGTIAPYDDPKYFRHRTVQVRGIDALAALLETLANSPRACVIRGRYLGDAAQIEHNPAEFKRGHALRRKNCFGEQPLHSVLIDVDGYVPLDADPMLEPVAAIEEYLLCCLPAAFHQASYYWQLSGSAGHEKNRGVLKAHVWFWLENPATSAALRAWASGSRYTVDRALFDTIQVHYTANPVFDVGVQDPVPVRSGVVRKQRSAVALNVADVPVLEKPSRQQMLSKAAASDDTAQALNAAGRLKGGSTHEGLHIVCPFEDGHSTAGTDSSTVYYPAHTGGYEHGHFKCLHASCADRTDADFRARLGMPDARIDDFDDERTNDGAADVPANSFQLASARAQAPMRPDLIQGLIPDAEFGIIYGKSGSGKSFAAIDLGYHLACGVQWRGRRVKQRNVFYVAAEGATGVRKRTRAYSLYHDVTPATPFYTRERGINLHEKNGWAKAAADIIEITGDAPGVIFIDTLSRSIPGVDENSAKDMSLVIENCQRLARATGCMVVVIAHAGKNDEQGVRGSSALRAAADFEIAISRHLETQWRCMKLTKSKDDVDGTEFGFTLTSVEVGEDDDGEAVFSAVAVPSDTPTPVAKRPQGRVQQIVLEAFEELDVCGDADGVPVDTVIDRVLELRPDASKNARSNLRRAVSALVESAFFSEFEGRLRSSIPQNSSDLI